VCIARLAIASAYLARELNAAAYGQVANLTVFYHSCQQTREIACWLRRIGPKSASLRQTWGLLLNPNDRFRWNAEIAAYQSF